MNDLNLDYLQRFIKLDFATQKYLLELADSLASKAMNFSSKMPAIKFKRPVSSANIILAIAQVVDESPERIISTCRKQELVYARFMSIYLLRSRGFSLVGIGELFSGRHHATILYAIDQHIKLYSEKIDYKNYFKSALTILEAEEA